MRYQRQAGRAAVRMTCATWAATAVLVAAVVMIPLSAAGLVGTPPPVMITGVVCPAVAATDDQVGYSVAIDGNTAVIGAPYHEDEGAAFIYEYNGYTWVYRQELPADPAVGDGYGAAVDIDGDYIVVGAPYDFESGFRRGTAHVYERTPTGWVYLTALVPSTAADDDRFGFAVAIDGTTAVVGAPRDDAVAPDAGAIYIFTEGSATPMKRTMAASEAGAEYGRAVDVTGNYLVAGAPFEDNAGGTNAGSALVYYGDGVTAWTATDAIYAEVPQASAGFGYSVSTTGGSTMVGAYTYDVGAQGGAGAVEVFKRSGSGLAAAWPWQQTLIAPQPNTNDAFGWDVSVSSGTAIVGAHWDDSFLGSAHVYESTPGGWVLTQKVTGRGWSGYSVAASNEGRFAVGSLVADGTQVDSGSVMFLATLDPVYRFYNPGAGTHFFTASAAERDHVIATWPTVFSYEGPAYYVNPHNNKSSLFRFYKPSSASHFYTASAEERDHVLATWPTIYQYDGPTYDVSTSPEAAKLPVYRFYNLQNGSHFYTSSETERAHVIATWPTVYRFEGPAFWLGQ